MARRFNIVRDPWDDEVIYAKTRIDIKPGVTVLVGCNGSGKTTLMRLIRERLKNRDIPAFSYNNLTEGGGHAMDRALNIDNDINLMATLAVSSEGEQININFVQMCRRLGAFVRDNKESNELWIFFDALDSGLSIDNIVENKDFLKQYVIDGNPDKDVYIVISANEYEMCRGENCFDVHNGRYVTFADYEEYRDFILRSREWKDKRRGNVEGAGDD